MEKVVLTLQRYEELKTLRYRAEKKAKVLEEKMRELEESGKVSVITKTVTKTKSLFGFLLKEEPEIVDVQGLDTIKDEVTNHFKKGLFDEQISKSLGDKLDQLTHQQKEIADLKSEISRLKSRNLWERITNK